jgi:hypothetical protein
VLSDQFRVARSFWAVGLVLSLLVLQHRLAAAPLEASEGQVVSIDRYGLILANPTDGRQRVFSVNQSTKIMRNGNLARLTDLRPGDQARITIRPLGDKLIALTVTADGQP